LLSKKEINLKKYSFSFWSVDIHRGFISYRFTGFTPFFVEKLETYLIYLTKKVIFTITGFVRIFLSKVLKKCHFQLKNALIKLFIFYAPQKDK